MGRVLTLTRSQSVQLAGWPAVQGQATGPGAFQTLGTTGPIAPGAYTVQWTVTLAGAAGGAEVNNFRLTLDNSTFLVESVNAGAAGTYPQAPLNLVIPPGSHTLQITVGPTNGSGGVVYTGSIAGQGGGGQIQDGPASPGELWRPSLVSVSCSATVTTGTCQANIYAGAGIGQGTFVDGTFSGDTGDTSDAIGGRVLQPGQSVFVVWSGGVPGSTATAVISGQREVP